MDFYTCNDFGKERLTQLHAEAREWNLANRVERAQRLRAQTERVARGAVSAGRMSVGRVLALASMVLSVIR